MNFIEHTVKWCRGEIFVGRVFAIYGSILLILSFAYTNIDSMSGSISIILPLAVIGLLTVVAGLTLDIRNQKRIIEYEKLFLENRYLFIESEKQRVESFIKWYMPTNLIAALIAMAGIVLFIVLASVIGKTAGVILALLSFSVIFLDHFSKERSVVYYGEIIGELRNK